MKKPSEQILAKAYEIGVMKLLKEVAESGDDVHENHTPSEICDMMLDKVDLASAKSILVLYNIELLFALRKAKYQGHVTFFTQSTKKAELAPKIFGGVNVEYIDKEDNPLYLMENKWPDKFDIVIANPPYSKKLDLKFLDKAYDIAKEQVIFVHPSTSFIDNKGKTNLFEKINAKILPHLKSIKLFNGNGFFGTALYVPFSITHINKKEKSKDFLVENEFSGIKYKTKDFNGIPVEGVITKENYQKLISKIKSISEKKNLHSEGNVLGSRQEHKRVLSLDNPFVVQFTHIRGSTKKNVKGWNSNLYEDDFFTIFRKTVEIERNPDIRYNIWFEFETQREAENFISFCKSSFARFCLSISKFSQHLYNGELKTIPWMDFTEEWTDEKLYEHFSITEDEKVFIQKVIPPYYD